MNGINRIKDEPQQALVKLSARDLYSSSNSSSLSESDEIPAWITKYSSSAALLLFSETFFHHLDPSIKTIPQLLVLLLIAKTTSVLCPITDFKVISVSDKCIVNKCNVKEYNNRAYSWDERMNLLQNIL